VARLTAHLATVNGSLDGHCLHAYGDSGGDREMLAIAHHPHYRPFREAPAPALLFLRTIA
jgi:phosphoserine phosphatase